MQGEEEKDLSGRFGFIVRDINCTDHNEEPCSKECSVLLLRGCSRLLELPAKLNFFTPLIVTLTIQEALQGALTSTG